MNVTLLLYESEILPQSHINIAKIYFCNVINQFKLISRNYYK